MQLMSNFNFFGWIGYTDSNINMISVVAIFLVQFCNFRMKFLFIFSCEGKMNYSRACSFGVFLNQRGVVHAEYFRVP